MTADDGFGGTDTVDVTINITDVREPPVTEDDAFRFDEDTSVEVRVLDNDSDPEDDRSALTVSVAKGPARGSVVVNAPINPGDQSTITYTPLANYSGSDSFTYRVTDTHNLRSNVATVALTVDPVNDPPAFTTPATTRSVSEQAQPGDPVGAPITAMDLDGDPLDYTLTGSPDFEMLDGTAQITVRDGAVLDATNQPTHTVTVIADDGTGPSASIEVTITVTAGPPSRRVVPIIIGGGGGGGGPSGPTPSEVDFEWTVQHDIDELDGGNDKSTGMWSNGATLWILDNADGAADAIYAYDLESGERVEEREFALDERNRAPRGVCSDRTVVWISDSGRNLLFAHDLASGERLPDRDIALDGRNRAARGIWCEGETVWVLDGGKDSLFAYDLGSGDLLGEFPLDDANGDSHGIWSDGFTVWVSDHGAKRLIAYRLPTLPDGEEAPDGDAKELERVRGEEFGQSRELTRASNNSPRGIWSDGDVMYVADESDDKVYTYNMPDAIDARLASLTLSGVEFGEFDPGRTEYEAVVADGVTGTAVEAATVQRGTDVDIDPPDADEEADGHQAALQDLSELTVTVTSADGSREKVYRVSFPEVAWDPARDPWPHCLRGAVSEGFSLVVFKGGSVEELVTCAESRDIVALYALHEGVYLPYILGAPDFVNREFSELFADELSVMAPLVAGSNGPPSADPFGDDLDDAGQQPWPECLRGIVVEGFSLVVYEGGSVEELEACAESQQVTALYALHGGEWVSYIVGAPEFANAGFRELFLDGLPVLMPLVVRSEGPAAAN